MTLLPQVHPLRQMRERSPHRQHSCFVTDSITLLAIALLVSACSGQEPPAAHPPRPSYGPEDALALDDSFSGHLFATAFVPGEPGDEPHFEERARGAESIWRLKVATVTREGSSGNQRRYAVQFRTLETLAGPPPSEAVALTISAKDPAFHWLDRVGGAWVGREVLLLARRYRSGTRETLHFHGEPYSPELHARMLAIRSRALRSERGARAVQK